MEVNILKTVGQIAGIGGISLGVLLIILRGIIRKRIFPKFKSEKLAYRLLRLIIIVVWTVAIAGIIAWVFTMVFAQKSTDTIAISNTEFSGDMEFANTKFILNQYRENHGKAIDNQELKDEIEWGMNLIKGGVYKDALPVFKNLAEKTNLPAVYNNLGGLYAINKDYSKAYEAYIKTIAKDPMYSPVQHNLGLLKEQQGKGDEALVHFEKASKSNPSRRQTNNSTRLTPGHEKIIETALVETEPNNDLLTPNTLPLNEWIKAEITENSDMDHFKISTPQKYRDLIKIELQNPTPEFLPYLGIFFENKGVFKETWGDTHGQNLSYSFIIVPSLTYYIRIASKSNNSHGAYRLKVTPMKAYDLYEPNNDMFTAKTISIGKTIEANIMDNYDDDYYRIITPPKKTSITVSIENQSTTLQPKIVIYLKNKELFKENRGSTLGQNLELFFPTAPGTIYYIRILGFENRTYGAYRLTISEKRTAVTSI